MGTTKKEGGPMRIVVLLVTGVLMAGLMPIGPPTLAQDQTCADFSSQAVAQGSLELRPEDPNNLDPDGVGVACEVYFIGQTSAEISAKIPLNSNCSPSSTLPRMTSSLDWTFLTLSAWKRVSRR